MSSAPLALFDDYPGPVFGHHPDFLLGLAEASCSAEHGRTSVRAYCPPAYLSGRDVSSCVTHRTRVGRRFSAAVARRNLTSACRDASRHGCRVLLNLFMDENYDALPVHRHGLRLVHALHRPGEALDGARGGRARGSLADRAGLRDVAGSDLVVVHTRTGERQALRIFPPENVLRVGWPAATRAEMARRFATAAPPERSEPYALLIGGAREDKGIHHLLESLESGPPLLIAGQQSPGDQERLTRRYGRTRIVWETGWLPRERLEELIVGSGVVVFPYLEEFARHGGASAALAQALTFGKPLVVSEALAPQAPRSEACLVVPCGEPRRLRKAIDWALGNGSMLHEAAKEIYDHVRREHTFEHHIDRITDRLYGESKPP